MAKKTIDNKAKDLSLSDKFLSSVTESEKTVKNKGGDTKTDSKPSGNQWEDFLKYAQEYKEAKRDSIQVWLDADVNYTLDAIRQSGLKIPVKHLLSAAVKVFLQNNADEVRALMEKKPKMII